MELTIIIEKIFAKIEKEIFDLEDIKYYIDYLIDYLELNVYFNGTKPVKRSSNFAAYSFKTLFIKFNLPKIIKIAHENYQLAKLKTPEPFFINMAILESIYHEVMHVFHNYVFLDSDFGIKGLFGNDIMFLNALGRYDTRYDEYYLCFPIERDASITSLENILRLLRHYDNKELFELYLQRIKELLHVNFDEVAPIEKLYTELYHLETPTISNIDLYDRIKLGFPISFDGFIAWCKNDTDIILQKNKLK